MEQQDRITPEEWAEFAAEQKRREQAHAEQDAKSDEQRYLEDFRRLAPQGARPAFPVGEDQKQAYRAAEQRFHDERQENRVQDYREFHESLSDLQEAALDW